MAIQHSSNSSSLADVLERVLDKGIVIAGDISISVADVQLLNIKVRLLVASVERAKEMGIDWWEHDAYLSSKALPIENRTQKIPDADRDILENPHKVTLKEAFDDNGDPIVLP
ncbi:gas vesicle protein [Desulfosporosinus sp. SYSU MS00001]|uniref:gas vesicle protein n=1 Tax=Desulfosporosinus sp. SYSU MS00001 TaxID=3416284 RepID=UPI003CEE2639